MKQTTKKNIEHTIYQGRDGGIYLAIGKGFTLLQAEQLGALRLVVSTLPDFDWNAYHQFYTRPWSAAKASEQLAALETAVTAAIKNTAWQLLSRTGSKSLLVEIDGEETENIFVGDYEPILSGHPRVESILIEKGIVSIKLELFDRHEPLEELTTLSTQDKIAIMGFLESKL